MSLEEEHAALCERWTDLRKQMYNVGYILTDHTKLVEAGDDFGTWRNAKVMQLDIMCKVAVTEGSVQRLGLVLDDLQATVTWDVLMMGKEPDHPIPKQ